MHSSALKGKLLRSTHSHFRPRCLRTVRTYSGEDKTLDPWWGVAIPSQSLPVSIKSMHNWAMESLSCVSFMTLPSPLHLALPSVFKKIFRVPKKVMPMHAVARLVLSFSCLLRSAFQQISLFLWRGFWQGKAYRLDNDASGTVAYEEEWSLFHLDSTFS